MSGNVATLNFGAIGSVGNSATVDVALPAIGATWLTGAWLRLEATADHPVDDLISDPIDVFAGAPVAGVGFTIYGRMPSGNAYGLYKVNWGAAAPS